MYCWILRDGEEREGERIDHLRDFNVVSVFLTLTLNLCLNIYMEGILRGGAKRNPSTYYMTFLESDGYAIQLVFLLSELLF